MNPHPHLTQVQAMDALPVIVKTLLVHGISINYITIISAIIAAIPTALKDPNGFIAGIINAVLAQLLNPTPAPAQAQ